MDYRLKENRLPYFKALYNLNLKYEVSPGLVYLYMPELKKRLGWNDETALWFATINGHTQNPITSMRIMEFMPTIPQSNVEWREAHRVFNDEWSKLSFDTDRNKQKKDTIKGLFSYGELVKEHGTQVKLWSGKSYEECWALANSIKSFGRLSTFSYLEYVKINGFGADCTDMMFNDFDGSRSHRNGMFFLLGSDDFVFDKRMPNGQTGKYAEFDTMCEQLQHEVNRFLRSYAEEYGHHKDMGYFTLESCLCQFKNGFFSRRYPGVYADMAWDRIKWYDSRGMDKYTGVFKEIRADRLPDWLREECESKVTPRAEKASQFAETGMPFCAEHFLGENK